jgi:hypothetical protein
MLCRNPTARITIDQIKKHPWFPTEQYDRVMDGSRTMIYFGDIVPIDEGVIEVIRPMSHNPFERRDSRKLTGRLSILRNLKGLGDQPMEREGRTSRSGTENENVFKSNKNFLKIDIIHEYLVEMSRNPQIFSVRIGAEKAGR